MSMGMWTFLAIVSTVAIVAGSWEKYIKYTRTGALSQEDSAALSRRVEDLERRMENLESICIEQERTRKFDEALIRAATDRRD